MFIPCFTGTILSKNCCPKRGGGSKKVYIKADDHIGEGVPREGGYKPSAHYVLGKTLCKAKTRCTWKSQFIL